MASYTTFISTDPLSFGQSRLSANVESVSGVITVNVKLYGVLRRHKPVSAPGAKHQIFTFEVSAGAKVDDLAVELGINPGTISAIAVNGEAAAEDTKLQDGDEVRFFPPSAGG